MQLTQLQHTANQREAGQSSWVELCRWLVQTKVDMTILCTDNHPQSFFQFLVADQSLCSVCPGLTEPRSLSELASDDHCLKICDVAPFATTLSKLNNLRDLDLDCSAASCLVQWTRRRVELRRYKWAFSLCSLSDLKNSPFLAHPVEALAVDCQVDSSGKVRMNYVRDK